jgi:ABC-type glycerol-3-phosphate transport system substrate-binding protein
MSDLARAFELAQPGRTVHVKVFPYEQGLYGAALEASFSRAKGEGLPDVVMLDARLLARSVDSTALKDLGGISHEASQVLTGQYPYLRALAIDDRGKVKAIGLDAAPVVLFFRKSLARSYLGSDDPERVSLAFRDLESALSEARAVSQKSGGRVNLFADIECLASAARRAPWVVGGSVAIGPEREALLAAAGAIRDEGLMARFDYRSRAWFGSLGSGQVIAYALPAWAAGRVIRPNAKGSSGDWGVARLGARAGACPTWLAIHEGSRNAALAWEFIRFAAAEPAGRAVASSSLRALPPSPLPASAPPAEDSAFMGGSFWEALLAAAGDADLPRRGAREYALDAIFEDELSLCANGRKDPAKALADLKRRIAAAAPGLKAP